ncbi:hypothetical protein [Herbiconiux daphne]|uniref:HEAT repeat domain-containing protein n=1 Tax=Herbiconiux daphne TaxID=2970914 RepID=A0ABT2GZF0_9MICO|nr:hypothetical protein [Herbiconiux daphne]MCS5733338.1 hypothetical protein [Herbiconiux daphne]
MTSGSDVRQRLRALPVGEWSGYLAEHSGLPGPRANLELAQAVADVADADTLRAFAQGADEYRALCGAIGLGRLLVELAARAEATDTRADADADNHDSAAADAPELRLELRRLAADERWRVREGVAMALQRLGDAAPETLWALADQWLTEVESRTARAGVDRAGTPPTSAAPAGAPAAVAATDDHLSLTEVKARTARASADRAAPPPTGAPAAGAATDDHPLLIARAVAAGIAEPRLVRREQAARRALGILDRITALLVAVPARDRRHGDARVLRQVLGYCWSVALVGAPADGFDALDRWAASGDADAAWIVRENLKKARLVRADPERAETLRALC